MTYRSLFVEEHPDQASATAPHDTMAGRNARLFCTLNAYTWPQSAWAFARELSLHTDYVDNCWLLVALDGPMLTQFLRAGQTSDPNVLDVLARVKVDGWYVINEEEF